LPGSEIFSLGTLGCNFACSFCQNYDISQATRELKLKFLDKNEQQLRLAELTDYGQWLEPEQIVGYCVENNIPSVAFTYNEPAIFFEYAFDTARLAKKSGLKSVFVSNGYESDEALLKIRPYLDAINIDLKAFSEDFYLKTCRAKLAPVLETIKKVHELGIWLEITTLVIPGKNDSEKELSDIAEFIASIDKNIPWHVTKFHPDYKMLDVNETPLETLELAYSFGKKAGLNFVYVGNVSSEHESTFCPNCGKLLIRRNWYDVEVLGIKNGKCDNCKTKIPGVWK
ncbi:MAG: AmmeMemoRadiSam system radical SAM enzyme, partial [Candidatus Diapherotrites archaeon]